MSNGELWDTFGQSPRPVAMISSVHVAGPPVHSARMSFGLSVVPALGEVAAYCKADVVGTYRAWLRHKLFRGHLTLNQSHASEANLAAITDRTGS